MLITKLLPKTPKTLTKPEDKHDNAVKNNTLSYLSSANWRKIRQEFSAQTRTFEESSSGFDAAKIKWRKYALIIYVFRDKVSQYFKKSE